MSKKTIEPTASNLPECLNLNTVAAAIILRKVLGASASLTFLLVKSDLTDVRA